MESLNLKAFVFISSWLVSSYAESDINGCPRGFGDRASGSCYFFSHDRESWMGAFMSCRMLGGFLVEIETEAEFEAVRALARVHTPGASSWVGLTDKRANTVWEWATSGTVHGNSTWSMWADGEPDHYSHDGPEDCALLDMFHGDGKFHDFQLADVICDRKEQYICEYRIPESVNVATTAEPGGVSSTTGIISILRTSLPTTHVSATPPPNSYPNISHPTISPQLSSDPFYEMFCSNVAAINCAHGFDVTCGSDGRLYPNRCELTKERCLKPDLVEVDLTMCVV